MEKSRREEIAREIFALAITCENTYNKRNNLDVPTINSILDVQQRDIVGGINVIKKFSDGEWQAFCEMWNSIPNLSKALTGCPVKKFKRAIQLIAFSATGNPVYIQASVRTAILSLCIALSDGDLSNRAGMVDKLSSLYGIDDGSIPAFYISTVKKVLKAVGMVGRTTVPTQLSVSYGGESPILLSTGILTNTGAVNRGSRCLHGVMKGLNSLSEETISNVLIFKRK